MAVHVHIVHNSSCVNIADLLVVFAFSSCFSAPDTVLVFLIFCTNAPPQLVLLITKKILWLQQMQIPGLSFVLWENGPAVVKGDNVESHYSSHYFHVSLF